MDYGAPKRDLSLGTYADSVTRSALAAYRKITFRNDLTLATAETTLTLNRRVPGPARLEWARPIVAAMGDRPPKTIPEVYAREAILMHEQPVRELKLQAIRVGDLGITAIPNEVYALTGLKIKARSPLPATFNIELANGSEGYIPPPEQHALGGYTTWPARTAALEVQAEPRIVEALLALLERVAGRPRRAGSAESNPYQQAVMASRPSAYYRLEEMDGRTARDSSGHSRDALIEGGAALFLPGVELAGTPGHPFQNHAVHLAGGRLLVRNHGGEAGRAPNSVELWFWNGLPNDARAVTGDLVGLGANGVRLAIGGTKVGTGKLLMSSGDSSRPMAPGAKELLPKTWYHVVLVNSHGKVVCFLDGRREVEVEVKPEAAPRTSDLSIGGDEVATRLEGKVDEVALFDRALSENEVVAHFKAAGRR